MKEINVAYAMICENHSKSAPSSSLLFTLAEEALIELYFARIQVERLEQRLNGKSCVRVPFEHLRYYNSASERLTNIDNKCKQARQEARNSIDDFFRRKKGKKIVQLNNDNKQWTKKPIHLPLLTLVRSHKVLMVVLVLKVQKECM